MTLEIRSDRIKEIFGSDVVIERLATGFDFTEGPSWSRSGQYLIFSDIPGDHMRRWSEADGVTTFRKPSNMANGNAYDPQGRIVTCEHATSRVTRTDRQGAISILATHYRGKELNSPNDIVVRTDGGIYFTDPTYGRMEYYGVKRDPELDFRGVYRIEGDGSCLTLLADDFAQPNGLCFSLDEQQLFVNDTERGHIRVFDVAGGGTLSGGKVWADVNGEGPGGPDGLKIDSSGNVYCCGPGGLHVHAPDGQSLGVIRMPEVTANFAWGGLELRDIFLTATTSLYRVRTLVPGLARITAA
jgi:gluconolactonase